MDGFTGSSLTFSIVRAGLFLQSLLLKCFECIVFTQLRVGHPFFSKERSVLSVLLRSFQKNVPFFLFFYVLFKRTFRSFRSFTFFSKERSVLSVLLRSFQKNVPFFPFFSVLLKRTECSFLRSFWFHKSY